MAIIPGLGRHNSQSGVGGLKVTDEVGGSAGPQREGSSEKISAYGPTEVKGSTIRQKPLEKFLGDSKAHKALFEDQKWSFCMHLPLQP
jgi:hypothetical protein